MWYNLGGFFFRGLDLPDELRDGLHLLVNTAKAFLITH
jgi:hypothetical protein